jgi:predicted nucleic acid-binding protein
VRRAVLADTSPLYAAVDPEDTHHRRALEQMQRLASERREIVVSFPILLEAYSLILLRLGRKGAARWLVEMTDAALLNPTVEDYREGVARVRTLPDQRISLVDATLATLSIRLGLEVWTYDHHFDVMRVPVWR